MTPALVPGAPARLVAPRLASLARRGALRAAGLAAALLALLSCGGGEPPRVLVLGLDGMDPRTVDLLVAEGKMPSFAHLRQHGAYGELRSSRPLLSPILWTTIATGKTADQHGITDFTAVDPSTGGALPVTSDLRRARALWNIASEQQRTVAVVGWWATWPPEAVNGAMVSDHTAYHFLFAEGFGDDPGGEPGPAKMYPPSLAAELAPLLRHPGDVGYDEVRGFADVERADFDRPFAFDDELAHFRWALATAESYGDVGLHLWRDRRPHLAMVYIEATDSTSHLFGHLFRARGLAGELAEQQARYGGTVEAMYRYADDLVGRYLEALDERTTLVVLSDHGFDLGRLHDDPSKALDLRRVSERFHSEEGILYLYGRGVAAGAGLERPTILDVAPTVLTLLELPAARDMPGRVLTEGLRGVTPPVPVASYEDSAAAAGRGAAGAGRDSAVDEAALARLRSLGYLDGGGGDPVTSPAGERNRAAVLFETGRLREAARLYRRLVDTSPDDASLRTSFAGVLGALGRLDQAERELLAALALQPVNPEAEHNLGVIAERRGRTDLAAERYRNALRYRPGYEPSRRALVRLTGSGVPVPPLDAAARRAAALAGDASLAARRGDYARALRLLDEAEALAPGYVAIYQYRSNVGYLMGDRELAITALERALALEPDNALFRDNLRRLRAAEK